MIDKRQKKIPLHIILDVVSDYYGCSKEDIFTSTRKQHLIIRRHWFQYLSRTLNPKYAVSSEEIGAYYSDISNYKYDHATILHSTKKIKGYIQTYKEDKELDKYLKDKIYDLTYQEKTTEDNINKESNNDNSKSFCAPIPFVL